MCGTSQVHWQEGYVQAEDGALIYFRSAGEGPAALLCDGIGCDAFAWRFLAPALCAAGRRVIHFHNRGHGRSPAPADRDHVGIEHLADDAIAVLHQAGEARAVLLGHSMGVQTCLEAYRRHPDSVRGLVLTCGSFRSPLSTLYGSDLAHHALPLLRSLVRGLRLPFRLLWRAVVPTELAYRFALWLEVNGALVDRQGMLDYLAHLARVEPELFLRMLAAADRHSAADLLERIQIPVLVVGGGRDGFTPIVLAREMARRIPGARLLEVPDGTHATPLERPALVAAAVLEFLASCEGA